MKRPIDILLPKEWGSERKRLLRALYGLRISPRLWYLKYRDAMLARGWKELESEPGVFYLKRADGAELW